MDQLFSDEDILNKDILELLGIQDLDQAKKQEIYQTMMQTIQNRVMARILDQLKPEEAEEWKNLLDSQDKQKAEEFLRSRKIDVAKLMLEEAVIYKTEIIGLAGQIKNSNQKDDTR